jgi:hypothetical protein
MNFASIVINKVDNGYVVNVQKTAFGQERPEQTINVFASFDEVLTFIKG